MDFFTALDTLWKLRAELPLAPQQADLVHYLLLRSYQQGNNTGPKAFSCHATAEVLLLALDQSPRNLRRLKSGLIEQGWLAKSDEQPDEWMLRIPALCTRFKIKLQPTTAPPRTLRPVALPEAKPAARKPRPAPAFVPVPEPTTAPALKLEPLPAPVPRFLSLLVPDEKMTEVEVVSSIMRKPIIVNGSGVKLRYEESLEACDPLQLADLRAFEKWQAVDAPKLAKFEQRITAHQLTDLYRKFSPALLAHVMRQLDNKKDTLRRYSKAHRTIENWCGMDWNQKAAATTEVVDENPLPATLSFLVHEARQLATTTGDLFTAPASGAALPSAYSDAVKRADERASMYNYGPQ